MGWLPSPADPRKDWLGYEFAIILLDSGMLGGPEINLVYRVKTDAQWSSIGASDGNVYMAEAWGVPNFPAWWDGIKAEINARLSVACGNLGDAPALRISTTIGTAPNTWAEFKAWLRDNLIWGGGSTPPTHSLGDVWGDRDFLNGYATEVGLRFNSDGTIERIERVMIPNVGWQPLPRAR